MRTPLVVRHAAARHRGGVLVDVIAAAHDPLARRVREQLVPPRRVRPRVRAEWIGAVLPELPEQIVDAARARRLRPRAHHIGFVDGILERDRALRRIRIAPREQAALVPRCAMKSSLPNRPSAVAPEVTVFNTIAVIPASWHARISSLLK